MRNLKKHQILTALTAFALLGLVGAAAVFAATTPSLGAAGTFGILSSTFTRNVGVTVITGDLGYTSLGGSGSHTVTGTTTIPALSQAGTDQGAALSVLAAEACDFTFGSPTDLSLLLQPLAPGVYCMGAATSIGTGGITLSGSGTYLFRIDGAFTTVDNSIVTLSGGANACDVFWTPTLAATLGANTTFVGTIIDDAGVTIGSTSTITGRILSFGGTVTTNTDTITVPTCSAQATLNVIKLVVNGQGGTLVPSNFNIYVKNGGVNTFGSPAVGLAAPGRSYSLNAGTYVVSEDATALYTSSFTGDCDSSGNITLTPGATMTCTIVNTNIAPQFLSSGGGGGGGTGGVVVPLIGLKKVPTPLSLPGGSGSVAYDYTVWNVGGAQPLSNVTLVDDKCSAVSMLSGDTNLDSKLDPGEIWKYRCTRTVSETTTNTAVATGYSPSNQVAIATAIATVVVGAPVNPPLIHILKVPSRLTPFPLGGGDVTYTYTVTNPGIVSLSNVTVVDNKCSSVSRTSGDLDNDNLLDPSEIWLYSCKSYISASTMNTAMAQGHANGLTAISFAFATVLVATPGFPNTGLSDDGSVPWNAIALAGLVAAIAASFVIRRNRAI